MLIIGTEEPPGEVAPSAPVDTMVGVVDSLGVAVALALGTQPALTTRVITLPALSSSYSFSNLESVRAFPLRRRRWDVTGGPLVAEEPGRVVDAMMAFRSETESVGWASMENVSEGLRDLMVSEMDSM